MTTKPRVTQVLDAYAIENAQPWCCAHAGFCARGTTPTEAYDKLMAHLDFLKRTGRRSLDTMRVPRVRVIG